MMSGIFNLLNLNNSFYINSNIFSYQNIFLIFLALIWIFIAVIQDFRKREVANWWNFSLISFVLAFRAFYSINNNEIWYFLWGLIGLIIGFCIANLFYYARVFAGGDAKLILAIFTILPLSLFWQVNLFLFLSFIILFMIAGAFYGSIYTIILCFLNFTNFLVEFRHLIKSNKKGINYSLFLSVILTLIILFFKYYLFFIIILMILILPFLFIYAKAIENTCLIKKINPKNITIGDWIVKDLKIDKKIIKPHWEGLNEQEVNLIRNKFKNKVTVKEGLPFTPSFFFGFIVLVYLIKLFF